MTVWRIASTVGTLAGLALLLVGCALCYFRPGSETGEGLFTAGRYVTLPSLAVLVLS